jgi:proliferating cell nuclear antigen
MFSIQSNILNSVLDALLHISKEVRFDMSIDGISIKCVDGANVELLFIDIPKSVFETYNITGNGQIALDIDQLKNIVKGAQGIISISQDEETKKLKVEFGKTKYMVGLIDPSSLSKLPNIPNLQYINKVSINKIDLIDAIKALEVIGCDGGFIFKSENDKIIVSYNDKINSVETSFDAIGIQDARSVFSIDYMGGKDGLTKSIGNCSNVIIEFGTDFPMRVHGNIGEVVLEWIIAPRIETED